MSIKTCCLVILFNSFLYSQGFFIDGRNVRKFFRFIPTFYDSYKREASEKKGYKEQGQHEKHEDNINEKLNKFYAYTREKPENILDYEDSERNENYGRYGYTDNKKNLQKHYQRFEIEKLRELDKRIRSGMIKLVKVKNGQPDDVKNKFVLLDSVADDGIREVNSDYIFKNNEYGSQPTSFSDIAEYGHIFGGESDYFS